MKLGLYIHIPFCKKKCLYCDFSSYQGMEASIGNYVECLEAEIKMVSELCNDSEVSTIFIGGGTPSYVEPKYISSILEKCRECFRIDGDAEISMESNPGTLTLGSLQKYKSAGVNRLSIGLQAVQKKLLSKLGRIHDYEQFLEGYDNARKAGFDNINIDLMFGLPDQTVHDWQETLEKVCALKPEHLSCYSLKIEENTPFYNIYHKDTEKGEAFNELPSEDDEREMYHYAVKFLKSKNFKHYEISNFALKGYECRHNLIYWKDEPYIGIGAGAHSYYKNERFNNIKAVAEYIEEVKNGLIPRRDILQIDPEESRGEYIMLGLRLADGVNKREFLDRFGTEIEQHYNKQIIKFERLGLLVNDDRSIKLTERGFDLANQVMSEFI